MYSPFDQAWDVIHIEQLILKIELTDEEYAEFDAFDEAVNGPLSTRRRSGTPPTAPKPKTPPRQSKELTDEEYAEFEGFDEFDDDEEEVPLSFTGRPLTPTSPPGPEPPPIANQPQEPEQPPEPQPNPVSQMMAPAQGGGPESEGFWSSVMNPQGDSPFRQEHLANRAPAQFNTIQ